MSNSPLVTYTNLTPYNRTKPRRGKILYIIPHCYVGQVTAKRGCDGFYPDGRGASAHYVIGYDGQIGQSVDEANRAWTTGGNLSANGYTGATMDHYAVTIEVACDSFHPYAITPAAYDALIRLMADIAQRNGIQELRWKADKSLVGKPDQQNVLVHRWFANKACPGDYIYNHLGDIVAQANKILRGDDEMTEEEVKKIVKETVAVEVKAAVKTAVLEAMNEANPVYKDLKDVPAYWQDAAKSLLDAGAVNGGTPAEVNATDLNLRAETLKAAVVAVQYVHAMLPGGRGEEPPTD